MRDVAKKISEILKELAEMGKPGVNLLEIETKAAKLLKKYGVKSFNKDYKPDWAQSPYPAITCLNVNSIIAHGTPNDLVLEDGDILGIDLGIVDAEGYCGDAALTIPVGNVDNRKSRLLYYANKTIYEGIKYMQPGTDTRDIAEAIQKYARTRGYKVNRRFAGHKIGPGAMHQKPNIYNTVEDEHKWGKLEVGDVYCIEPFLTPGGDDVGGVLPNGWTYATQDAQPSAFFEHMVLITKDGPEILTDHFKEVIIE